MLQLSANTQLDLHHSGVSCILPRSDHLTQSNSIADQLWTLSCTVLNAKHRLSQGPFNSYFSRTLIFEYKVLDNVKVAVHYQVLAKYSLVNFPIARYISIANTRRIAVLFEGRAYFKKKMQGKIQGDKASCLVSASQRNNSRAVLRESCST